MGLKKVTSRLSKMGQYKSYLTQSKIKGGGGVKATFGQCPKEIRFFMSCLRWVLAESPNRPDRQQAEATRQKEEQAKKINENHAREIKEELARTLNEEQAKKMKENQVRKTKEDIKRKRQAYLARSGLYWTAEKYMHYMKEKKNITIWY